MQVDRFDWCMDVDDYFDEASITHVSFQHGLNEFVYK